MILEGNKNKIFSNVESFQNFGIVIPKVILFQDKVKKEKGINKESLLEAVEQAMLAAYKKHYGEEENVEVEINRLTGEVKVFEIKTVVTTEDLYDAALEVSVEDAAEAGHRRVKVGDVIKLEVNCEEFRRHAIQTGKQIVIQKVREAARQNIIEKFKGT